MKKILNNIFFLVLATNTVNSKPSDNFDIDEEASVRALEHSLIQSGSLLLESGKFELGVGLNFSRRENNIPMLVLINKKNQKRIKNSFVGINTLLHFRMGLSGDMQIDFSLPLQRIEQRSLYVTRENTLIDEKRKGFGIGDAEIRLSRTLIQDKENIPNIIGFFSWNATNGKKSNNGVLLNSVFNEFKFGLTATKTQDPLVFSISASAQKTAEKNNIRPGNQYAISLATFLAASPSTSLRFSIDQFFIEETINHNKKMTDSNKIVALLNLGVFSSISAKTSVSLSAGAGLTNDAPNYTLNLSLSTRF
jgi:hypothetical protein